MKKKRNIGKEIVRSLKNFAKDLRDGVDIRKKYRCTRVVRVCDSMENVVGDSLNSGLKPSS